MVDRFGQNRNSAAVDNAMNRVATMNALSECNRTNSQE